MAHAPYEIAVRSRNAALPFCKYSHVAAKAWPACRGGNNTARFDEDVEKALMHRLKPYSLRSRDDDAPHTWCDLPSLEDAYAIAKALGATVEKLLTGKNASDFPEGINMIAEKSLSAEPDDIRMINAILGIDREPYILSCSFNDWF